MRATKRNYHNLHLAGLHLLDGLISLYGKVTVPSNCTPAILRNVETTLPSFCSTSLFAVSSCTSWVSSARILPSAPPSFAFNSWICCVASTKQISKLCFWSSRRFSRALLSSKWTRRSCSRACHCSSSCAPWVRVRPNSWRICSRFLSSSEICAQKEVVEFDQKSI